MTARTLLEQLADVEWDQIGPVGELVRTRRAELEVAIVAEIELLFSSSSSPPWNFRDESREDGGRLVAMLTGWELARANAAIDRHLAKSRPT